MKEKNKAYSEILAFLEIVDKKYVDKIPKKLLDIFEKEKDENYFVRYRLDIPIEKQSFQKETLDIIAMLYLNYWYETEEEKQAMEDLYNQNALKREAEAREKYNPDNIFKKAEKGEDINTSESQDLQSAQNQSSNVNETSLVEYKENWFKKLLEKIKTFFKHG